MNFRPINDPQASPLPVAPNRPVLLLGVFVAAVGFGAVVCYGLALLRPVFNSARALKAGVQLPVLGVVTNAWPEAERAAFRRAVLAYATVFSFLVIALVTLFGIELFGPGIHAPFG